jgi:hypothetical protein
VWKQKHFARKEITQMVKKKDTQSAVTRQKIFNQNETSGRISSKTHYDFSGKQMSAFGGTFLIGSLIERLNLYQLFSTQLTVKRKTKIPFDKLMVAMVILIMLGFERLQHIIHISTDSLILRVLGITKLPVQSTLWRFLNRSLHKHNERQLQEIQHEIRNRVWRLANVQPTCIHINTDTTSSIAYGNQDGAKVGYCPGKRGAKCFRPILSSISETGEIILAQQRRGDRVGGIELAKHLKRCINRLSFDIERIWRADSEFYCKEAIMMCESTGVHFIVSVRKTAPVTDLISKAQWIRSDVCHGVAEFSYMPQGWKGSYRFVVARYEKEPDEQTDLFEDAKYKYRVFVTDMKLPCSKIVTEYDGRAGIENLIEEAKNQVAFAKILGKSFIATSLFLQIVTMAFNMGRYLQLFGRDEKAAYHNEEMKTIRQTRFYISARIIDHGRQPRIRFGSEYPRQGWFTRIMTRLRSVDLRYRGLSPVISTPLLGVICRA